MLWLKQPVASNHQSLSLASSHSLFSPLLYSLSTALTCLGPCLVLSIVYCLLSTVHCPLPTLSGSDWSVPKEEGAD